ncbi:hypothetical protein PPL_01275 [Heterostelium album PN500]|uniref:Solute carrier family 40 protein n=1 Tax=Heterostelium pallidum (strain ATCC 26659 / Pp 5 / PN500) TaxID=670386 RepID=D3AYL5_HETP5|nr:hypothetical protein PPL_01275 [Heterostelium album PN500]EFA86042.1 hypothetical protein PPL_01275 [Heterostelium album PN500]|eukprot:XP_020438148.1 hypothetical protein PPL_01275 [Heterostelium album PN500]
MKTNNNNILIYLVGIGFVFIAILISSNYITPPDFVKKQILLSVDYTKAGCNNKNGESNCSVTNVVSSPPDHFIYFGFGEYLASQAKLSLEEHRHQQQQHKHDYHYLRVDSNPYTLTADNSIDHVKFLMLTNQSFELPAVGRELVCRYNVRLQTFNTDKHPFGSSVHNPEQDLRLAAAAVNSLDFATNIVADFLITNNQIYVVYERLPFAGPEYAAFTFAIPIRTRQPNEFVELAIAWDAEHQIVRWLIDNREVYRVSTVGYLISREYLIVDRGGREELVFPKSVQCGAGTFTLLDGSAPCLERETTVGGGSGYNLYQELGMDRSSFLLNSVEFGSDEISNSGTILVLDHDSKQIELEEYEGDSAILINNNNNNNSNVDDNNYNDDKGLLDSNIQQLQSSGSGGDTNTTTYEDINIGDDKDGDQDVLPLDIERRVSLYMLASHLITRMGDKMWDFMIPLTLIVISPTSLIPSSLYGLSITFIGIILSPSVGRMVDIKKKLPMIRTAISCQVCALGTSAVLLYLLMRYSESSDNIKSNIFSHVGTALCFFALLISASIHSVASSIMNISVERKWVPKLIKRDSSLTKMNTRMRQIDLVTEVSAPFIAGLLTTIPHINELRAFMIVALFNFASFFPQFYFLQLVHNSASLQLERQEQQVEEEECVQLTEHQQAEQLQQQQQKKSYTLYNPFKDLIRGWKLFIRQSVFLVVISFVLLWFTILSPHDPLLTAYLSSSGYTNLQLAIFRGVGALFGLLSTFSFEPMVKRFGLANTTTIYIAEEGLMVLLAGLVFTVLPLTTATRYIFLILIVVSRVGLYGFELGEIHFVQRAVQDSIRGNISGVETSLTSLAMLAVYIGGLAVHSTANFSILIWLSIGFINIGVITLLFWRFTKPIDIKLHKLQN